MKSRNPATGELLEEYDTHEDTVAEILKGAEDRFLEWRNRDISDRRRLVGSLADILRDNETRYAELMTAEMGKPITQARAEVQKCAWGCEFYAERAGEFLQDRHVGTVPDAKTYVAHEPLGPVLAVMPWNFPFWQVFRFAAPALAAGNTALLKHSSNVPGCALAIEEVFEEAGFPEGCFSTLLVDSASVSEIVENDRVPAVTLTGSEYAGRSVAETAGRNLKKCVLELGGSDPYVVLDDADVADAAATGAMARNQNSGQSCIAAKRFIVVEEVYDEFLDALAAEVESLQVGDPTDEATDVGPQASEALLQELHQQVEASVDAGATVVTGGEPLEGEGAFYPPTILADVPEACPARNEELFGPVAAVFEVADAEAAVELANDTRFGLGASVWTADRERGERLARRIDAGCVFVNEMVKSDPRLPFGGVKDSGFGRELSRDGILEFVNRKTVWIE
ncbi:NAD-dependent succinate-semialdehyde dehydrogenase [Natronomonas marina]|uniref:NAD-dependent succinate-semialdehyde dehydrogenase n=1 Tax=Natronomonas marina TaxID=2961939 RepID=UPI0020C97CA1|nr:NAD-dependent succinate-semialdehyde dehydrogenase [Natronomonas marina]